MSVGVGLCFASLLQACLADTTKASKSTQTPQSSSMINWANLDVVDYLRSGALIVAFLAILLSDTRGKGAGRGGKKNMWVNAEVVAFFLMGMACFFFPTSFLEYFTTGTVSFRHAFFVRMAAVMLIGEAYATSRRQNSIENDSVVHINWLLSRLITSGCFLLMKLQAHSANPRLFTDQHATFVVLGLALWFVGCLWQFFTAENLGGSGTVRDLNSGMSRYLVLMIGLLIILSVPGLANPKQFAHAVGQGTDDLTVHLVVSLSMIKFCLLGLPCFGAMFYSNDEDKKAHFYGHMVIVAVAVPTMAVYQWKYALLTQTMAIASGVAHLVYAGMLYHVYHLEPKEKTR